MTKFGKEPSLRASQILFLPGVVQASRQRNKPYQTEAPFDLFGTHLGRRPFYLMDRLNASSLAFEI